MSTHHIFIISALVISGVFFGILSMFGLPQTIIGWVITDGALAMILYISYLVIASIRKISKP
ncbi:C4-dicarboxylate ABC transporter [Nitrosomonas sp.]|uniref:C4-dicarboxylate ABC transporter n=1 Tax=Nitrosomonas sp. TaxID=42353 RepID=UPI001DF21BF9|nr:C4-dicarboxylate ABC transporter [Nitrosomonas sp.]MBX3616025.1 C4-dicarboxylate ABC transporter [Nitrosomonas sp.]